MHIYPIFVFILTIISPGCLIFLIKRISLSEKAVFTLPISALSNGLVYTVLRDLKILNFPILLVYFAFLTALLIFVSYQKNLKRYIREKTQENIVKKIFNRKFWILFLIIAFFTCLSFYYSWFFPPTTGDALRYHLVIPQSVANGTYFDYLAHGGIQSFNFSEVSTCFEMFYFPFFLLNSNIYRIIPVLFGVILLFEVLIFFRRLNVKYKFLAIGMLWLVLSPNIMNHSAKHFVDLPLACFTVGVLYFLYKHLNNRGKINLKIAGLLGGLGGLVKPTLLYIFVPLILLELIFYKAKWDIKLINLDFKGYIYSFLIFISASAYFFLRKLYLPHWLIEPGVMGPENIISKVWHLLPEVIYPSDHGFSVITVILSFFTFSVMFYELKNRKITDLTFLKLSFVGWLLAIILGAGLIANRMILLKQLWRFTLPVYPILILAESKDVEKVVSQITESNVLKRGIILILIGGALLSPTIDFIFSEEGNYVTSRMEKISSRPFEDDRQKLVSLLGEKYLAWEYVNSQSEKDKEIVLTNEWKIFYLKNFALTIRRENILSFFLKKWTNENISWIIFMKTRNNAIKFRRLENFFTIESKYDPEIPRKYEKVSNEVDIFGIKVYSKAYIKNENKIEHKIKIFGKTLFHNKSFHPDWKVYKVKNNLLSER